MQHQHHKAERQRDHKQTWVQRLNLHPTKKEVIHPRLHSCAPALYHPWEANQWGGTGGNPHCCDMMSNIRLHVSHRSHVNVLRDGLLLVTTLVRPRSVSVRVNRYLSGYLVSQQQTGILNHQQERSNSTESTLDVVMENRQKQGCYMKLQSWILLLCQLTGEKVSDSEQIWRAFARFPAPKLASFQKGFFLKWRGHAEQRKKFQRSGKKSPNLLAFSCYFRLGNALVLVWLQRWPTEE